MRVALAMLAGCAFRHGAVPTAPPDVAPARGVVIRTHSVFRDAMDRCHALATPHLECGLLDVIFAERSDDALVNRTDGSRVRVISASTNWPARAVRRALAGS